MLDGYIIAYFVERWYWNTLQIVGGVISLICLYLKINYMKEKGFKPPVPYETKGDIIEKRETEKTLPSGFKLRKKGSLSYIVDKDNKICSKGYHEFKIFESQDGDTTVSAIIGKLGAAEYILMPPTKKNPYFKEMTESYHELKYRPDLGGLFLIEQGALSYIIDHKTGKKISKGYHNIYEKDGHIYGELGASVEEIKVTKKLPN